MVNEFGLIDRIRARVAATSLRDQLVLGIGDDAAVLQPNPDMQLVATADNLVRGQHFDDCASPTELGHLALVVNLSDLAAMGAIPRWSLLTLTLPEADEPWLDGFLDGYLSVSQTHQCALVGGNITRGPLNIAVTALGEVPADGYVSRSGAQAGDRIVVTGTIGDAAAALRYDDAFLRQRLLQPTARVEAGRYLARHAHAMIDVSDGVLADLRHLLGACGAEIYLDRLPTSEPLKQCVPAAQERWPFQLNGGGDYELLALLPAQARIADRTGDVALHEIGQVTASGHIRCVDPQARMVDIPASGWDHFLQH
ncbi:MAG: thiamine-phosphate kinase [Pseudomonadota bacterium]